MLIETLNVYYIKGVEVGGGDECTCTLFLETALIIISINLIEVYQTRRNIFLNIFVKGNSISYYNFRTNNIICFYLHIIASKLIHLSNVNR